MCGLVLFRHAALRVADYKRPRPYKRRWAIRKSGVLSLEFRFSSVGRFGYFYVELGLFNSGKVMKNKYENILDNIIDFPVNVFTKF